MRPVSLALVAALLSGLVPAAARAQASDEAALSIADQAAMPAEEARDWRVFVEGALRETSRRATGVVSHGGRLSIDLRYDKVVTPGLRAVFADRLDLNRYYGAPGDGNINTLKEAYLSWQPQPDRIADFGRINVRSGAAAGYNPTDYFKVGALRSVSSVDPASLREHRQGSAMLRGQALWEGGSVSALYSPKLADRPNPGAYNVDIGSTNNRDRWLVTASHKLGPFNPQFLLSGGEGQSAQLGLNLSGLLNDSTVAFVEWSGGRSRSLLSQALGAAEDARFRNRIATGFTHTTANNISITAEYDYNGAGLDKAAWDALRAGPPVAYGRYRTFAAIAQDPATRHNFFFYATWTDAFVKRFDLTAMLRYDAVDSSRLQWLEARYRWTKVDLALQAQVNSGKSTSNFGALQDRRITQVLLRYFF